MLIVYLSLGIQVIVQESGDVTSKKRNRRREKLLHKTGSITNRSLFGNLRQMVGSANALHVVSARACLIADQIHVDEEKEKKAKESNIFLPKSTYSGYYTKRGASENKCHAYASESCVHSSSAPSDCASSQPHPHQAHLNTTPCSHSMTFCRVENKGLARMRTCSAEGRPQNSHWF